MTEELSGLCAYTDGVKLKLAFVMKIEKKRARALISTGREIPLPIKNLIFSFTKNLSEDEFLQACSSMEEEISKFAKLVDLPMLWEMLSVDNQKTFHFND